MLQYGEPGTYASTEYQVINCAVTIFLFWGENEDSYPYKRGLETLEIIT